MITIFENDEFPIYIDIKNNKVICQGFCMQCCYDIKRGDCKKDLLKLAKVKYILECHNLIDDVNLYNLDIYSKDLIKDVIDILEDYIEDIEINSEIASKNEIYLYCIRDLEAINNDR